MKKLKCHIKPWTSKIKLVFCTYPFWRFETDKEYKVINGQLYYDFEHHAQKVFKNIDELNSFLKGNAFFIEIK